MARPIFRDASAPVTTSSTGPTSRSWRLRLGQSQELARARRSLVKNVCGRRRFLLRCEPGQPLEASEHAHSTKEIGRLCFYLVLVWAEHRKILPYAKSDRHQRSLWSRLAADEVREDSQHDPTVGVHCSRCARLFLIIFCNLLVIFFTWVNLL